MDSKKSNSNKIREIVRLQQILKKWKKLANAPKSSCNNNSSNSGSSKSIKFLKKTLSFSDSSTAAVSNEVVPKGFLAVCVGKEEKRFIIPMEYLSHQAFGILLREAEEEFGFQQEGVLKIPCEVPVFERILKMMQDKREVFFLHEFGFSAGDIDNINFGSGCYSPSPDCEFAPTSPHPQMCR